MVPEGVALLPGIIANISLTWNLRLLPGHGFLTPLSQQAKQTIIALGVVVIDPDYQEDTGLALHKGGKKDCVWRAGDPLGHLLPLPCPVNKVDGKLQQPHPGRMKKDDRGRTFRMRV